MADLAIEGGGELGGDALCIGGDRDGLGPGRSGQNKGDKRKNGDGSEVLHGG